MKNACVGVLSIMLLVIGCATGRVSDPPWVPTNTKSDTTGIDIRNRV